MVLRLLLLVLVIQGCAQVEPLTGGASDTSAPIPKLSEATPPMASVNMRPAEIKISFNEYITLKNAQTNISVVPELSTRPEYSVQGRELLIKINPQELLPNTTYSFVFNGAVADFTEGNDSTFTYVFSTGATIDSLTFSAVAMDVLTQQPVKNAKIGLYPNTDSLNPYKSKPLYSAQSNKEGFAEFAYLSARDFRVFAFLDDAQLSESSTIAFLNRVVQSDTSSIADTLWLFQPQITTTKPRILKKNAESPGRIELVTNFEFATRDLQVFDKNEQLTPYFVEPTDRGDSCVLWISAEENSAYTVHVPYHDTIFKGRVSLKKNADTKIISQTNLTEDELEVSDTLMLSFNKPIDTFDLDKLLLLRNKDTVKTPQIEIVNLRSIQFLDPFAPNDINNLVWPPESIVFYDGTTNKDSIVLSFKRKGENKYANLEIELTNRPNTPLVVQLFKSDKFIEARAIDTIQTNIFFNLLSPGEYNISVVFDENGNGEWDTGSFFENKQPEKIIVFPQKFTLRANWDTKQPVAFQE